MDKKLFESDGHRNKWLIWFVNECKHRYSLSVEHLIGSNLLPKEKVIATSVRTLFSGDINSVVKKTVEEQYLSKIENADNYRFLPMVCDFVIFQNSPLAQAKYSK